MRTFFRVILYPQGALSQAATILSISVGSCVLQTKKMLMGYPEGLSSRILQVLGTWTVLRMPQCCAAAMTRRAWTYKWQLFPPDDLHAASHISHPNASEDSHAIGGGADRHLAFARRSSYGTSMQSGVRNMQRVLCFSPGVSTQT